MIESSKQHPEILKKVKDELHKWSTALLNQDSAEHLQKFLEARANLSTSRIKNKTGLLVA